MVGRVGIRGFPTLPVQIFSPQLIDRTLAAGAFNKDLQLLSGPVKRSG
jgi:hypothetical protein